MKSNRTLIAGVLAVVVIVAGGVAGWFYFNRDSGTGADSALMVAGPLGEMTLGDPDAPNTVIEYASLVCSHCADFYENVYEDFKAKYIDTGKVHFIFRDYPLNDLGKAAAIVAHCAPEERYFPLVDLMFKQQATWAFVERPDLALEKLVSQAGISKDQFEQCLTNQELYDGVTWVEERAANEFGVNSTPTFFINGVRHRGVMRMSDLDEVLGG